MEPNKIISSKDGGPYAFRTLLGWCIVGTVQKDTKGESSMSCHRISVYEAATKKLANHHYQIPLPLKNRDVKFPDNRKQAEKRLQNLEKKLHRNHKFYEDYRMFMEDMLKCGYAEKSPKVADEGRSWYLPHHGV